MTCVICRELPGTEAHHLHPIHLGGPRSGPTINICGNCHTFSHQVAVKLVKGQAISPEQDLWYNKNPAAKLVVKRIMQAMIVAEENPLENVVIPVTLKITKKLRREAHLRKLDYGKISLEAYLTTLLLKDLGYNSEKINSMVKEIKQLDQK